MDINEILGRNPIIPALKNEENLEEALKSGSELVFVIMSNLINIKGIVEKLKESGKIVFVHVDMIEGLSSSTYGIEYIEKNIQADGIITTKHNIVNFAKKKNICVIQRFFILDSFSFKNTITHIRENKPDAIEILPGLMPKVIKRIHNLINIPIITGGLIDEKQDIINVLSAGAEGISITNTKFWNF